MPGATCAAIRWHPGFFPHLQRSFWLGRGAAAPGCSMLTWERIPEPPGAVLDLSCIPHFWAFNVGCAPSVSFLCFFSPISPQLPPQHCFAEVCKVPSRGRELGTKGWGLVSGLTPLQRAGSWSLESCFLRVVCKSGTLSWYLSDSLQGVCQS